MNVWYHSTTIFNQRRALQIAGLLTLCVAFITMLFFSVVANAAPGVNQTISFQGRLLTPQGQPVPEGYYNIQFKIYEGGSGTAAGNSGGSLKWTETYINNGGNNAVHVKNGYFSVDLGSKNAFGNQVDWNDDTLWLSMNIAGSSSVCSTFGTAPCLADGEMLPMKRLTSSPYALNSGKLEGKSASDFIQNGTTQQTGNFNISGTGLANILQGTSSVLSPNFDRATTGLLTIGASQASEIQIGSDTADQAISLGAGTGTSTVLIGSQHEGSSVTIQGGTNGVAITSTSSVTVQGSDFTVKDTSGSAVATITEEGEASFKGTLTASGAIGALSANEVSSLQLLANNSGANTVTSSSNSLALQGNGTTLLTAVNNSGVANIGIGNAATNGYALDVTGSTNVSDNYAINGVNVLNNTGLNFTGASTASINAASGQALQLTGSSVKVGDGTASGDPTLLTLDKGATAPTATGDAVLGSMYYDTTLGKVQCYEADGWGACSSSPDNFVTLSPEYTNAVTNGSGVGNMKSDICSDTLNINDGSDDQPTICGTNETYNFYNWTSSEATTQTKDIYVTYQLPTNFTGFVDGSTSLVGRTDSSDATVAYRVYKNTSSGLVTCGSAMTVSNGAQTTWQKVTASGSADPANCNFSAGDSLVLKISLSAKDDSNAYASTLSFAFKDN